jgi:hypothetical protein
MTRNPMTGKIEMATNRINSFHRYFISASARVADYRTVTLCPAH